MTFANPVAWWAVPLLVGAAAWLAWNAYARPGGAIPRARRLLLISLRFASLMLLVLLIMRPVALERASVRRDALVAVLVDVSRSMQIADADADRTSRVQRAAAVVRDSVLPALQAEFRTEVLAFGERVAAADLGNLTATHQRSDLEGAIKAVRDRYRGKTLAGIVVVSDGGDTGAQEPGARPPVEQVPVYAIGVGASPLPHDREVLGIAVSAGALADSVVRLSASVVSHGYGNAPFEARVLENGRLAHVRKVTAEDGTPVRIDVPVTPNRDAATIYTVDVAAGRDELVAENNTRSAMIRPAARRRRVLLAQGAPGYEHSFLARALLQDPALELDSVVRKGRNDRGADTFYIQAVTSRSQSLIGGFPITREALFAYDVIILANLEPDFFKRDQLGLAATFVSERGGGLLVLGGRSFDGAGLARTPLEEVLPVELRGRESDVLRTSLPDQEANRMHLTSEGEAHPIMQFGTALEESRKRWADVPSLGTSGAAGVPRPGATVLATTGTGAARRPIVAVQRYGRGRSMIFAGEGAWRWRMLLPSADRTFDTFWRQAVRWLAEEAGDPVAVVTPTAVMAGQDVSLTITVRDGAFLPVADALVAAEATAPDGAAVPLHPAPVDGASGRYTARFKAEQRGVYRLRVHASRVGTTLGAVEDDVLVGGEDVELTDPRLNEEVLRRLATASGGRYSRAGEVEDLRGLFVRRVPDTMPPVPRDLWHNAGTLAFLVLLLSGEWVLRRRSGLR